MNQEQNSTKKIWLLTFYLFLDPEDDETLTDKTRDLDWLLFDAQVY